MQIEGAIDATALLRSGIYILKHAGAIVYIGQAKVMLTRVYSHRTTWGRKRTEAQSKGVLFDEVFLLPVPLEDLSMVEQIMIAKYKPKYNTQHNNGLPPDIATLVAAYISSPTAAPETRMAPQRRF